MWSLLSIVQYEAHHRWKKSLRLNWTTQFLTVAYDGACSPNDSVRMAWISFAAFPLQGEKKNTQKNLDSSRLDVVEIARVDWYASFSLCNKKWLTIRHMNKPFFSKTSIPSHDKGIRSGYGRISTPS